MGLFRTRDERRARRAERKRNRAERKRNRANALDRKADQITSAIQEEATIYATDANGRQVKQEVMLRKESSAKRNARLYRLEARVDELEETNAALLQDIDELEDQLDGQLGYMERKQQGSMLLSKGFLGVANTLITFVNVEDGVRSKGALIASEAMDALIDLDQLDDQQKDWARIARVVLKAAAYFDPKVGLMSILESEKKS